LAHRWDLLTQSILPLKLEHINRILVIKLRAIGDVLLSTPVVQNLHDHFPDAEIDFLTDKFAADVVSGNPWITGVITFDKKKDSSASTVVRVRKRGYDLVIDLFSNPRSAVITGLSGARFRVGFPFRLRKYAYNIMVPPRGGEVHNVDFNLDALRRLEIPVRHFRPYFPLDNETKQFAVEWVRSQHCDGRMIVGLNPSGGWNTKRWGLDRYARLGDLIAEKYDASIVLLWGPGEEEDVRTIQRQMKCSSHIIPPTTLPQLGAIIQQCSFVVSNDSGPMHIAASLNIATLGIFGPTNPYLQGPYGTQHHWIRNEGLECLACNLTTCPIGHICMTRLDIEQVMEAFDQIVVESRKKTQLDVHQSKDA
jgi:ADP-heptose:LPS heptosyltransferase